MPGAAMFGGAGATHVGGRARNEDSLLANSPVFIVADGMGGHVGGAAASAAVVEGFAPLATGEPATPDQVADAVDRAREGVARVSASLGGDAGSTLTGAVGVRWAGTHWWMVINVGDSRVYALDGGALTQVTVDHSHVQELVDAGRLTPEEAAHHPDRNIVTRAIGDDIPGMDAWLVPLVPGRRLVIASDGLTTAVPDRRIAAIASTVAHAHAAAAALVDAALANATSDNVTVVVADSAGATDAQADPAPWPVWGHDPFEADDLTSPSSRAEQE
ncbi:PP2C family protein-serine/threonine phosphatase [Demequina pelophila]|uniref:PP2C family protein-serine/threonine phosphatase n=1 Tax=Demequina pelophila TaxID=1638984 RepID=UPI0007821A57|nr:protein phosphatase 2C domain-containing protein [Demequina pelophila]